MRMALLRLVMAAATVVAALATPPGFDPSESGFISVPGTTDSNLFYWLIKSVRAHFSEIRKQPL